MDRQTGINQIRKACNNISVELMSIHPAVPSLAEKETQDEIYKSLFQLTKEVETVKKRIAKLEKKDDSTEL